MTPTMDKQAGKESAKKTSKKHDPRLNKPTLLLILLVIFASASAGFAGGVVGSGAKTQKAANTEVSQKIISSESDLISNIAKNVGPSVVAISVASNGGQGAFGFDGGGVAAGTGFIISADGLIATNRHVISSANSSSSVTVTLSDGTELDDIKVVGSTNEGDSLDLAFLKIGDKKGKDLQPVKLGDSSKMKVGEKVVAIGNALGQFQNTVTTGIISGYGRDVRVSDSSGYNTEQLTNLFQTDAAINQGNSGGPLVNSSGEVIGINTAAADTAENIGFAIPINDAKGLIDGVLKTGKLERPYLGVRYVMLTDDIAYTYNLDAKRGAYIMRGNAGEPAVVSGSPADKAGLKEKDIITKIDGEALDENNSLVSLISRHQVGETVELTILRDGKEKIIKVKLEAQ